MEKKGKKKKGNGKGNGKMKKGKGNEWENEYLLDVVQMYRCLDVFHCKYDDNYRYMMSIARC